MTKLGRVATTVLACAALGACAYRPPRFADEPPVTELDDQKPIAMPARRVWREEFYVADAYVRRPVMAALDPARVPDAMDVSSLDDVPRSTWLRDPPTVLTGYKVDGPPAPPLRALADKPMLDKDALAVIDARGKRYELRVDPKDRPEMTTAAEAIASRLLYLFGLLTPEVWIAEVAPSDFAKDEPSPVSATSSTVGAFLERGPAPHAGKYRVSATRWSPESDLGATLPYPERGDDPNNTIAHAERRSLRALKLVGAWLAFDHLGPGKTRETFVGWREHGHVEHYVVGLKDALGTARIVRAPEQSGKNELGSSPLMNLVTLGMANDRVIVPTQTRLKALGAIDDYVDLSELHSAPPWDPVEHALPTDDYWASKRVARIDRPLIIAAVAGGAISDPEARLELIDVIDARRQSVIGQAMSQVTPVEVDAVEGNKLWMRDQAITLAPLSVPGTAYAIQIKDDHGRTVGDGTVAASGPRFGIALLGEVVSEGHYSIVRILGVRGGASLPRACQVHLVGTGTSARVVGVRH